MTIRLQRRLLLAITFALLLPLFPHTSVSAQPGPRTFPETGKPVGGRFLEYWQQNGGLPQQGYPISNEMQERSETDGRVYTVQYFERAVFEMHPENRRPHDVLLSLLGVFMYSQKYPAGAPNQQVNNTPGSALFPQTGKRLGGRFLQYWQQNGGLPQQGYPISDEFLEQSDLNGQTYLVQYFERAVFEYHPENRPPHDVLLSHLGTFQYRKKYAGGPLPPSTGCTSPIQQGVWAGAFQNSATWTGARLNGTAGGNGTIRLEVACSGAVTGTTTVAGLRFQFSVAEVGDVLSCVSTQEQRLSGVVRLNAASMPEFVLNGQVARGNLTCTSVQVPGRGPLLAPNTNLAGTPFAQTVAAEQATATTLSGRNWAPTTLLDLIVLDLQRTFSTGPVQLTSTGSWTLSHQPVNTP